MDRELDLFRFNPICAKQSHIIRKLNPNKWIYPGVNKKHQKFIFEYWVFSQKSYLNMWCFEKAIFAHLKFNICIPKLGNLHTMSIFRHTLILSVGVTWHPTGKMPLVWRSNETISESYRKYFIKICLNIPCCNTRTDSNGLLCKIDTPSTNSL